MRDRLEHWKEWKQKCALGDCQPETKQVLPKYIQSKVSQLLEQLEPEIRLALPPIRNFWHEFETFSISPRPRAKIWKDYLFDYIEGEEFVGQPERQIASLKTGIKTIVIPALIEKLKGTLPDPVRNPDHYSSLSDVVEVARPESDVLDELIQPLPTPDSEADRQILEAEVQRQAASIFERLETRHHVAVASHYMGLAVNNPIVMQVAGCGHDSVSRARREAGKLVWACIRQHFGGEPPETVRSLCIRTVRRLEELCYEWAQSEDSCGPLFNQ
jgi:hypothetical protein